jgi:hypothetical protein
MNVEEFIRTPAKLPRARHELCTWGEPARPGVAGGLSRKRYTQCVEHNRKGRPREQENTGRGPIMEEVL